MSAPQCEISWFGDRCLRLQFGESNTPETRVCVRRALQLIESADFERRFSLTPAYTTILVRFDPLSMQEPEKVIRSFLRNHFDDATRAETKSIEIPICYEDACAPDLASVAEHSHLSPAEVIRRHSGAVYEVAFVGFTPGFGYLTGLPPELATPRLPSPRTRVPPGSLGIAGDQSGIYPSATPGGWRLIGQTPFRLFDAERDKPSLLSIGDQVRFVPIARAEFNELARRAEGGAL